MANKRKSAIIEYRNYYLPPEFPVLLLSGEHWRISDIPSGRLHFHNCLEIGVCHSDSGTMEIMGVNYHFKAGDVVFVPQNIPHTTYSDKGCASRWSYIYLNPPDLFKGILPPSVSEQGLTVKTAGDFFPIISRDENPDVFGLAEHAIRELEDHNPGYQMLSKCLLVSLCMTAWRTQNTLKEREKENLSREPSENMLVIEPVLSFIEKNYAESFSMDTLADLCHLSPTHFRRIFVQIMGTGPLEYVNNIRIFKACDLLRGTEDSVLAISEAVGFKSIATFNRRFLELMQMTPRSYRTNMQLSEKRNVKQTILEFSGWLMPEK